MFDPSLHTRRAAAWFVLVAVTAGCLAAGLALALVRLFPFPNPRPDLPILPLPFLLSTLLLAVTSGTLERAVWLVRNERQSALRKALSGALASGICFTSVQAWGLSALRLSPDPADDAAGVNAFLFVFAALHAVHVLVALLCLAFVLVRTFSLRYDHEYYWGIRFCAWFWHALGALWMVILGAFGLAAFFLRGGTP